MEFSSMCVDLSTINTFDLERRIAALRQKCEGGRPVRDRLGPTLDAYEEEMRRRNQEGQKPSDLTTAPTPALEQIITGV